MGPLEVIPATGSLPLEVIPATGSLPLEGHAFEKPVTLIYYYLGPSPRCPPESPNSFRGECGGNSCDGEGSSGCGPAGFVLGWTLTLNQPPGTPGAGPGSGGWIFCSALPGSPGTGVLGSPPGDLARPLILLAQKVAGPSAATGMDLEMVVLSEVSQIGGEIPCDIPCMWI